MRTLFSQTIQKAYPDLDRTLWRVACCASDLDSDIMVDGLLVRVKAKASNKDWSGWAHPTTRSTLYGTLYNHPAGRIDLSLGTKVTERNITILFAHEMRHIGQFHRGRHLTGFLNTAHMDEPDIELDCYSFEKLVTAQLQKGARCRKSNGA